MHEEVSWQKIYFWQIDCLSNLAILYGLCILDSSFLYWPLLQGVSNKHCLLSFFSLCFSVFYTREPLTLQSFYPSIIKVGLYTTWNYTYCNILLRSKTETHCLTFYKYNVLFTKLLEAASRLDSSASMSWLYAAYVCSKISISIKRMLIWMVSTLLTLDYFTFWKEFIHCFNHCQNVSFLFTVTTKHLKWVPVGNQAQIVSSVSKIIWM